MKSDLTTIQIEMHPVEAGEVNAAAGYQAHAAFLDLVRQLDPVLSQQWHDLNGRKPFTLSTLCEMGKGQSGPALRVSPDRRYYLRLTGIGAGPVGEAAFERMAAEEVEVRLGRLPFRVVRLNTLSSRSFGELCNLPPRLRWHFRFHSPTVFSLGEQAWGGRKFGLFPEPKLVFENLAASWNTYVPQPALQVDKIELGEYLEKFVIVSGHNLQTATWQFAQHQQLGFTGTVNFRTMEQAADPRLTGQLTALAAFAEYAGVGYKTAMGMGQTSVEGA